jgi:hypothetical protein
MVKAGMSYGAVSTLCNIPKTTLKDRVNFIHGDTPGWPSVLKSEEEAMIIEMVDLLANWGFPFKEEDLRRFVKSYLDKKGVTTRSVDNLPIRRFVTTTIKRTRASLSREEVQKFFDNFRKSAEGVTPEIMYNFDKTNFHHDSGSKRCLFKRGTKYCEKVQNASKRAMSMMCCGSGAGEWVPPMVIYKAQNLYTSWCQRGPKGAVYAYSKSGWFDMYWSEMWFMDLLLPRLKRRPPKSCSLATIWPATSRRR